MNEHGWAHASGTAFEDMSLLGYRWDSQWGMRPTEMDSHLLLSEPELLRAPLYKSGWLTGAWRSAESRTTFVSDAGQAVHRVAAVPRDDGTFVDSDMFPSSMAGVWGFDDDHVYAWGDSAPGQPALYRWDGRRWHDMECPGTIYAMHGIAPDLIYAVGELGMVARWNGHRWESFYGGTKARLASVFVASADEMYACGVSGVILEGSVHGWVPRLTSGGPFYSIAKFANRVLVAGGYHGLLELDGVRVETLTADVVAEKLEARGQLILSCPKSIYVTTDFVDWRGLPVDQLEPLVGHRPPAWETHPS